MSEREAAPAPVDICGLSLSELTALCTEAGLAPYRSRQLFEWVQRRAGAGWAEAGNISGADKARLAEGLSWGLPVPLEERVSADGTRKFLFQLADGETIETVLLDYRKDRSRSHATLCLSVQVGCALGCPFCATGRAGWRRNLSPGEITGQLLAVTARMRRENASFHVGNLVFMGMGEPFYNMNAFLQAVRILNDARGQNIGARRMTVSTAGVVPGILRLAAEAPQIGLAVSLHAGTDELRDVLVPLNRRYPLARLMEACREYVLRTGRRITFEMALTEESATETQARAVAALLRGLPAHVNLIPVNIVAGSAARRPTGARVAAFRRLLTERGLAVTIREERGADIEAACGQLRQSGAKRKGAEAICHLPSSDKTSQE
ncbi:MAG: 23S rRNA (adenine(2503)-C(2))-methyltransferase RlmN [Gracilibacteraceae bacterium]|jgi:23S rRNA (adenine2503-C2)-methyltransferase|nr:23S rRNA (adenine(2503)-C(2))-methyltransferase RlmN [Gracilibacteraceae bacterium]